MCRRVDEQLKSPERAPGSTHSAKFELDTPGKYLRHFAPCSKMYLSSIEGPGLGISDEMADESWAVVPVFEAEVGGAWEVVIG
jgi:hypothetical protein